MEAKKTSCVSSLASMSENAILQELTASVTKQARSSTFSCGGSVSKLKLQDILWVEH